MIAKLIAFTAAVALAGTANAHPLPTAKARTAAHTVALDGIMGEVQLDALIARLVPADAKHATPDHRVAVALPAKAHGRA